MAASDHPEGIEAILTRLRAGDEQAFEGLVAEHGAGMLRLARVYCPHAASAEEAVQDAWLGFLESLDRFEGRASIKTWLYRILVNCARARARKDGRTLPLSSVEREAGDDGGEVSGLLPGWFPRYGGHWWRPPDRWDAEPEELALRSELREQLKAAIERLPESQRLVLSLRDVEGFPSDEVCNLLGVSDTNQRVLLHRARTAVRRELDAHLRDERQGERA